MRKRAFTLIEITIVITIIGLLIAIAVPNFVKARNNSRSSSCAENRRVLDSAKQFWMIDNQKVYSDAIFWKDIVPEYTETLPKCPLNGQYKLNTLDEPAYCSKHGS